MLSVRHKPLNEVESVWIRRPVTVVLSIPLFFLTGIVSGLQFVYDWYGTCW
jgi:hypothetical protein